MPPRGYEGILEGGESLELQVGQLFDALDGSFAIPLKNKDQRARENTVE